MNATVEQLMTGKDAQDRCSRWIEHVKEDDPLNINENGKHKLESECDDFVETDSEFDSVSECGTKRRKLGVQLKSERFDLACEWKGCTYSTEKIDCFNKHVANHVTELEIRVTSEGEVYACLWSGCIYETDVDVDVKRHLNYHAFHSKLKCIGTNVRGRTKLPVSIELCKV